MFGSHKVKIEGELLEKVKQCSDATGYESIDEFVIHMLEKETRKILPDESSTSKEEIQKRLRGLGTSSRWLRSQIRWPASRPSVSPWLFYIDGSAGDRDRGIGGCWIGDGGLVRLHIRSEGDRNCEGSTEGAFAGGAPVSRSDSGGDGIVWQDSARTVRYLKLAFKPLLYVIVRSLC